MVFVVVEELIPTSQRSGNTDLATVSTPTQSNGPRRRPDVADGKLVGVVSMNDLVLAAAASPGRAFRPTYKEVVQCLRSICAHHAARSEAAA